MHGDFYTLPIEQEDGPDIPGQMVRMAFSLAGALRGECVLVDQAELTAPAGQCEWRTRWGVFRRVELEHRHKGHYKEEVARVFAWQRI